MTERQSVVHQLDNKAAPAVPAADGSAEKKQRILWLAVGSLTAVIILLWLLLLPLQIKQFSLGSLSGLADRWRVVREENQPPASFRDALNRLHDRLVESSAQDQAAAPAGETSATTAEVVRLREKLETISENTLISLENAAPQDQGTK
ncbi:MAG: hypothetical protein WCT10_04750 [Patescibacteria group bacterium]|jgi:hypothetical protein